MNKELEFKEVWVQIDFGSTGVWVRSDLGNYLANASYEHFSLPDNLIKRFNYWEEWFTNRRVEMNDENNDIDELLFESYGRSLAIELKNFLKDTCRVYYGNYKDPIEILLIEREYNGTTLVPVSKQVDLGDSK